MTKTWQPCADLPSKYWITAVAELNGKVYVAIKGSRGGYVEPLMYDSNKDQWSSLPALPYAYFSLVTIPDNKQLLAIGGMGDKNRVVEITSKVFLLDEENRKWTTPYPNMPTARYYCSSISHGSTVIVVGGVTCCDPWTMTRAVEVLHILKRGWFTKSYWSVVEQLPHVAYLAIPLIISDKLYIAVGCDAELSHSTCNIVTASLPELLKTSNKNNSNGQVWYKLPDLPYSTISINHYQGRIIAFGGGYYVKQPNTDRPAYKSVPLIHIYNTITNTWDCVGVIPSAYSVGRSIHIGDHKIFFIGGLTGMYYAEKNNDICHNLFNVDTVTMITDHTCVR